MNTQTILEQSEIALAAYATLAAGKLEPQTARLRDEGKIMSASQADAFAERYEVVTQFNDTQAEGGMGTSFSATVFKDTSGNLTLAIRGTLEAGDFFPTDADIAMGAGRDQIVAMWNWLQRASSTGGQPVAQVKAFAGTETPPIGSVAVYADSAYNYYLVPAASSGVTANGLLANSSAAMTADADHKLNVTGHSLGGHLAMAFGSLFSGATSEVVAFNAPGFKNIPGTQQLFSALGGSILSDTINGLSGRDPLSGGAGNDHIEGGTSADHILGGDGDDQLNGLAGNDVLGGGDGKRLSAIQFIAAYAYPISARGRFDAQLRAVNDSSWEMAA
jgi:hypothetical protein